jgi:hypothetical protein
MPAVSLTDLQQQIALREQELQALREQLHARQSHLSELERRKQQLQKQLREVEKEITALARTATTPSEPAAPAAPTVPSEASRESQPRLGELIVTLLREGKQPMTARQLHDAAQRRDYQSSSRDPLRAMEKRLQDLKNQGIVRRANGQSGFLLASSAKGAKKHKSKTSSSIPTNTQKPRSQPTKSKSAAKKNGGNGASPARAARTAKDSEKRKGQRR